MNIPTTLAHAITEYDRRQSTRKGYNRYALGIMLGALTAAEKEVERTGKDWTRVLPEYFNNRLLDHLLTVLRVSSEDYRKCERKVSQVERAIRMEAN